MARPHALDTLVCGLAGLKLVVQVAMRWGDYSSWWSHSGSRGPVLLSGLVLLLMALLNRLAPRFYGRHRTAIILSSKSLVLAVASKTQVRLNHPPTGRLAADVFQAMLGLRLMGCAYSGLLMFPWPLWVAQQAATLAVLANLEQDCSSALLSHPITSERFARLHATMRLLVAPVLPQAKLLVPKGEVAQCKAGIVFLMPLACVLLPAVALLPPDRARPPARISSWVGRVDEVIRQVLSTLRFREGLHDGLLLWWASLVGFWALAALAFPE